MRIKGRALGPSVPLTLPGRTHMVLAVHVSVQLAGRMVPMLS
jgi:hypothetical protein